MDRIVGRPLYVRLFALADSSGWDLHTVYACHWTWSGISPPRNPADIHCLQEPLFQPRFDIHVQHPHSLISLLWEHRGPLIRPYFFFFSSAQTADGQNSYFLLRHQPASLYANSCLYVAGLTLRRQPTSVSSSSSSSSSSPTSSHLLPCTLMVCCHTPPVCLHATSLHRLPLRRNQPAFLTVIIIILIIFCHQQCRPSPVQVEPLFFSFM
jgi:hypothetical protein